MNLFFDKLPDYIEIDGEKFPIYTDFRNWIKIEILLSKKPDLISLSEAITLCYKKLPHSLDGAVRGMAEFYAMGKKSARQKAVGSKREVYSFEHDSEYIYSAFMKCYGIDLLEAKLHWWQFRVLFFNLDDCRFTKIMQYRNMDLSAVKNNEQKSFYRKMKRLYRLPKEQQNCNIEQCLECLF